MKRIFNILFLFAFLVSICIVEQVNVYSSLNSIYKTARDLQIKIVDIENINTSDIVAEVDTLYETWIKYESTICFFINHKDMAEMGNELVRMQASCASNNLDDFKISLQMIVHLTKTYNHIMGVSFQNIF